MRATSRIIMFGLQNFWRNGWLSFVATVMMTITLLTLSTYLLLTFVVRITTTQLQEKVNMRVDFHEDVSDDQIKDIQTELANRPDVKTITYISKQVALERFIKVSPELKDAIDEEKNPLPRGLEIQPVDPKELEGVLTYLQRPQVAPLVESNTYTDSRDAIKRLIDLTHLARNVGIGVSITFGIASMIVILYTIVLTIYSRREELDIMRLVGASTGFVRLPFLIEGVLYGVIGTIISTTILFVGMQQFAPVLTRYLSSVVDFKVLFMQNLALLIFVQLAVGIFIGTVSNWLGTRRFLKV